MVFGGQIGGEIVLIHSSDGKLNMFQTCSSHAGRITDIVGSSDPLTNCNTLALVTYGIDKALKFWAVNIMEASYTISLSLHFSVIRMEHDPQKMVLTNATLCFIQEGKQLIMFKLPNRPESRCSSSSVMNQKCDQNGHNNSITSLVICSSLRFVVTSSDDGTIKTWNLNNELLSELNIGVPLSSVGIANDNGDLLIATQNIVTILDSENHLPDSYTTIAKKCRKWDMFEITISFNPELEFW